MYTYIYIYMYTYTYRVIFHCEIFAPVMCEIRSQPLDLISIPAAEIFRD